MGPMCMECFRFNGMSCPGAARLVTSGQAAAVAAIAGPLTDDPALGASLVAMIESYPPG